MLRNVCVVLMLACLLSVPASAQTQIEVAAGYNVVNYTTPDAMPVGWFVSVAAKPYEWFALASELTAEFTTDETATRPVQQNAWAFLDGPRFIWNFPRRSPDFVWRASAFGEVLLGVAHDRDFFTARSGANHFVWQPGAGVDVNLTELISARFQFGARYASGDLDSPIAYRFLSGVVVTTRRSDAAKLRIAQKERDDARRLRDEAETLSKQAATLKDEAQKLREAADRSRTDAQTLRNQAETLRKQAETLRDEARKLKEDAEKLKSQ